MSTLPTRCCLPPSCFLPAVGREIKSTFVTSVSALFSDTLIYSVVVEEETEAR